MSEWIASLLMALPGISLHEVMVERNIMQLRCLAGAMSRLEKRRQDELRTNAGRGI